MREEKMTYYVVTFHADGGQACYEGSRNFVDKHAAEVFRDLCLDEPGHNCAGSSWITESESPSPEKGSLMMGNRGGYGHRAWQDRMDAVRFEFGIKCDA
jgi:hypothetical protein